MLNPPPTCHGLASIQARKAPCIRFLLRSVARRRGEAGQIRSSLTAVFAGKAAPPPCPLDIFGELTGYGHGRPHRAPWRRDHGAQRLTAAAPRAWTVARSGCTDLVLLVAPVKVRSCRGGQVVPSGPPSALAPPPPTANGLAHKGGIRGSGGGVCVAPLPRVPPCTYIRGRATAVTAYLAMIHILVESSWVMMSKSSLATEPM